MTVRKIIFILAALLIIVILLIHISQYIFMTDDSFISFRYAKNLASRNGLVFNIGEKVEGYTNFLWVIMLSIFSIIGIPPESIANILSIALSVALMLALFNFSRKNFSEKKYDPFILIAPLFLAFNRSYAVWSTGGLETRLFSFLIFLSVITLVQTERVGPRYLKLSALFFAVSSLIRPEGILLFVSFFGYYWIVNLKDKTNISQIIRAKLIYVSIVAAHFTFRLIYYGDFLPNTFYAKVTGAWFSSGLIYLLLFVHEYGLYFLLPLLLFLFKDGYDRTRRKVLLDSLIPLIPFLIYTAYLGGDHFEFRQLDIILPFLALSIQEGLRSGWKSIRELLPRISKIIIPIYLVIIMILYIAPSWLSHLNFPEKYDSALAVRSSQSKSGLVDAIPGFRLYLGIFDSIHSRLARNFVCIRQEEHKMAMEQVFLPQAKLFENAIAKGYIRNSDIICLWCVGAIPYYSNLTTIDFLGLTDRHIARRKMADTPNGSASPQKLMAHEKRADWEYLRERQVTFVSTRPTVFFFPRSDFFENGVIIAEKVAPKVFLVPMDDQLFVFRSVFVPEYFKMLFAPRGLEFYYWDKTGVIQYYPAANQ